MQYSSTSPTFLETAVGKQYKSPQQTVVRFSAFAPGYFELMALAALYSLPHSLTKQGLIPRMST